MKVIKVPESIPALVERFQTVMNFVDDYVVGRSQELAALKICMLTGNHLLLTGDPGLGKSRFALLAFRAIKDATVFRTMLHGQSSTDEIFGPPNAKVMREQGLFQFNTTGMLPEAVFAYIDEIFNGPGAVLTSTLNILNERIFINAGVVKKCPLHTAIGTTNKVSDSPELEAFVDRFLILRKVKPSSSEEERRQIIDAFLANESVDTVHFPDQLCMKELLALQQAVKKVAIPPELLSVVDSVAVEHAAARNKTISDRRYCWAYRALQANLLLAHNGEYVTDPSTDALSIVADVFANGADDFIALETLLATKIGAYSALRRELKDIRQIEESFEKRRSKYLADPDSFSVAKKRQTFAKLKTYLMKYQALPAEEQFTSAECVRRMNNVTSEMAELLDKIALDLGIPAGDDPSWDSNTVEKEDTN